MDARTAARLDALHKALALLDSHSLPVPATIAQRVAAGAMTRARSLLRAILVLLDAPGVSATEVDVLVRVLLEMAITVAWIGRDERRAARYRDKGISEARRWRAEMEKHGGKLSAEAAALFDAYAAEESPNPEPMPPISAIAEKTAPDSPPLQGFDSLKREYHFIYRRLCAAVHHDHRLQALVEPLAGEDARAHSIHAAAVALGVLSLGALEALEDFLLFKLGMDLLFIDVPHEGGVL